MADGGPTGVERQHGVHVRPGRAMTDEPGWVTGTLRLEGRTVYYRRSVGGSGTPVVHVHGFGISGASLMPTAQAMAGPRVNVVPDLPGYGRSERRPQVLDIPGLAGALLGVLDALEIERAVLVGNSMGCPISLEVAYEAPERVEGLVLVAPAGGVQNRPLRRAIGQLTLDVVRENPRMARVALPDYVRFGPVNALRLFHELTLFPSLERLLSTPVPTLAVLGGRDPLMPPPARVFEVAHRAPRHVTLAVIRQAAHAVNFSHPGELSTTIEAWLDGTLRTAAPDLPSGVRVIEIARDRAEPEAPPGTRAGPDGS